MMEINLKVEKWLKIPVFINKTFYLIKLKKGRDSRRIINNYLNLLPIKKIPKNEKESNQKKYSSI